MANDKESLLSDYEATLPPLKSHILFRKTPRESILIVLIILLLTLNTLQLSQSYLHNSPSYTYIPSSPVAGLIRNISIPRKHDTLYSLNSNYTLRDQLWESIDINTGIVALDQEFISAQNLPPSMIFPWEPSKNVYSTTAHHNLHCLKKLYKSVSQAFIRENQTENQWHLMHCLDSLRQDVLCNADDTLFYTYPSNTHHPKSGDGQPRLCKNFTALEEWARPRTACYAFSSSSNASFNEMEEVHFRRCPVPEGENYLPILREYFGVGDEWVPDYDEV